MRKNSVDPFDIIAKANSKNKDLIEETLQIVDLLKEKENREKAQEDFMHFVNSVWTSFIEGRHHKIMANAFERIAKGELKRLIINMPPRS